MSHGQGQLVGRAGGPSRHLEAWHGRHVCHYPRSAATMQRPPPFLLRARPAQIVQLGAPQIQPGVSPRYFVVDLLLKLQGSLV